MLCSSVTVASDITPSHVFQKTEVLRLTLLKNDFLDEKEYESQLDDSALRHPRHVMQKVRECHILLSKLLRENKVLASALPDLYSLREVRPMDVYKGVEHLIDEFLLITESRKAAHVPFKKGYVPKDVYNNLKKTCASIRVVLDPRDVFRSAVSVNQSLDEIMLIRGYDDEIVHHDFTDIKIHDVYLEAWKFMQSLRLLGLIPDFAIPGGIIFSEKMPEGKETIQDVMSLMNDAVSGTNAMEYALGVRDRRAFPEEQGSKTLSDIYAQIERAHRVVRYLLEKEKEE